ncbi:hypothetical protein ACQ4PT_038785 [Festuca glaucescens]
MAPNKAVKRAAKKAQKKATKNSKTNQPVSSKHEQTKEQPEPWRDEAEARVRMNRQFGMKDIKVFVIDINATDEEYEAFMEARVNHMRGVAATFVHGAPVTPPYIEGLVTYHIVRLTDKKGGGPSVELLFQEYNLYFIAFRIIKKDSDQLDANDSDQLDANGWFAFKDAEMPYYMQYDRISYTVSYDKSSQDIRLGFGVLKDILYNLSGYNASNLLDESDERELALHSTPYMMSELLRLAKALKEVADLIRRKARNPLTHSLVNNWGNISRVGLDYECCQDKNILQKAAKNYNLDLHSEGPTPEYSLRKLVGVDGYLQVLLYSRTYVHALLKKRLTDNPPTRVLVLSILTGQGETFDVSEVEVQLREECLKQESPAFLWMKLKTYLYSIHIQEEPMKRKFFLMEDKKVKVQQQAITYVELSSKLQTTPSVQDFTGIAAENVILRTAAVEKHGSSSNGEPSDKQIPISDHFTKAPGENVISGKKSVEQESEEPTLLEELHLLACVVRAVPSTPSERITISLSLIRRLGRILPPLQFEYYSTHRAKLEDLLANHQELFAIEGDLIHLHQGARQRISADISDAKVKASLLSRSETEDLPKIAVTPRANRGST